MLASPAERASRFKLDAGAIPDSSVTIVNADSLCERIASIIRRYEPVSAPGAIADRDSVTFDQIFLIRAGVARYLAQGFGFRGLNRMFVLDSSATDVIMSWQVLQYPYDPTQSARKIAKVSTLLAMTSFGQDALSTDLTRCATRTERQGHLVDTRDWLASLVGAQAERSWRKGLSLPFLRDSMVSIVSDLALCRRAAKTMNHDMGERLSASRTVFLLRVGPSRYWAESDDFEAGEWGIGFILDGKLQKVLARAGI
ncbi:MAG: hypothetical protein ABIZ70_01875 [Gemmatimonadales bacterium]